MIKKDKIRAILCWSGGKDSAYCLHKVLSEELFDVCYLLTTLNDKYKRVSMHGIRETLLDQQAASIGIPLLKVKVTGSSNEEYENKMEAVLSEAKAKGIEHVIFGDIFLEEIKSYRERNLAKVSMKGVFPLWKMNTTKLLDDFINKGFKSAVCCANDGYLGQEWLGRELNASFEKQLPESVDPCGENGEYHTFCYAGPIFKKAISFTTGDKVYKALTIKTNNGDRDQPLTKGFWFCDFLPQQ